MNCKKCGFPMMPVYNKRKGWQAACARCGAAEAAEAMEGLSPEAAESAARGWNCYRLQDFDEAIEYLSEAVEQSDGLPEYLWAKLLAQYGVKYCETEDGKYTVNFWRREQPEGELAEQADYKRLRREAAADLDDLRSYAAAADDIDRGLRQIREVQGDECDVFISFKDRDAEGPTPERALCDGLYNELRDKGLQVFYSPKTLYGKFTTDYEGYIYSALKRAKLLLIVTSSAENVSSPWVASEWMRFQRWNEGEDYRLMTCMVGSMKPGDFPDELSRYQHELRVELDKVRDPATIKWISGAIAERCRIAGENDRAKLEEARPEALRPVEPKPLSRLEKLQTRAKNGDVEAQLELGKRYAEGSGVGKDEEEAAKWYRLAAEQGNADAECKLSEYYYYGKGVEKDHEEAVKWFRRAKEKYCEAVEKYLQAAEQGDAEAQVKLGDFYFNGKGVERDYEKAMKWYHLAVEQGNPDALYRLGMCYYDGAGVKKDRVEALKLYRQAAEQGSADAQYRMGWCYYWGKCVDMDNAKAVKWFRKAAEQGHAEAQRELGWCYYWGQGTGVKRNYEEAEKWFRKAVEQGNILAERGLSALEKKRNRKWFIW